MTDLDGAGVPTRKLDLGDPGRPSTPGRTASELPAYDGPAAPVGGHTHEWGAAAAERREDAPLATHRARTVR